MMSMRPPNPTTQLDKMRNRVAEFGFASLKRADVRRAAQEKNARNSAQKPRKISLTSARHLCHRG